MPKIRWIKLALFFACLVPAFWLGWRAGSGELTANPIEFITHFTGDWAIRFIVFTLAVTPLRKLLHSPGLIQYRRMIGLFAFFYASLHFLTWFAIDKYFDMHEILDDFTKRRFIIVGLVAFVCLIPLAVTSTAGWIRRMGGKRWQLLHRLIYVTAIAAVIHYYWLVKSDIRLPLLYAVLVGFELLYRLGAWRMGRREPVKRMASAAVNR
jgi:methionine sulfoxide reductase heme-binding subunit